jgi:hypothetical protein
MDLVEWIIVIGAAIVIATMFLVLRANRRDEKDVWWRR